MFARLWLFVRERFPIVPSAIGAFLLAACADVVGARLLGHDGVIDARTVAAGVLVLALFFVVRGVDEIGDLDDDRIANPDRPLPRGAVQVRDVVVACVVVAVVASAVVGVVAGVHVGLGAVLLFVLTVGVQLDIGIAALARRPVLQLLVHQALVPLWAAFVIGARLGFDVVDVVAVIAQVWPALLLATALALLFEIGRKVHHVDDENALDDSWSGTFGLRGAAIVVVGIVGVIGFVVVDVVGTLALPVWSLLVPGVFLVWVVGSVVAFVTAPRRGAGKAIAVSTALASLGVYLPLVAGAV